MSASHWHTFDGVPVAALQERLPYTDATAEQLIDTILAGVRSRTSRSHWLTPPRCINFIATCVYVVVNCIGYVAVLFLVTKLYHQWYNDVTPNNVTAKLQLVALVVNSVIMQLVFRLLHAKHPYIIQPHIVFQIVFTLCVTVFATWR